MVRDFRPTDLETVHSRKEIHRLEIIHKETGIRVAGTGENKYALECQLLELLEQKIIKHEQERQQTAREDIPCLK